MQKKRILIFLLVVSTFAFAEVPDVVFKTLNNKNIYLHDYVGEPRLLRPDAPRCGVILIFFHLEDVSLESWLPPLNALIKDFKSSNRKFFFIATSQDVERLNTFQNTCNLSAPLYMDVFNVCANLLDVSSDDLRFGPGIVIYEPSGTLLQKYVPFQLSMMDHLKSDLSKLP